MTSNLHTPSAIANADIYTDLAGLQNLKAVGRKDEDAALRQVAQQFEAMMVQMMLKGYRDANKVFSEGNFLNSNEQQFYQEMFDQQLAVSMGSRGGMGLAEALIRQLKGDAIPVSPQPLALPDTRTRTIERVERLTEFDGSPEGFVKELLPMAERAAAQLGVAPDVLLAQAALETGWGKHMVRRSDGSSSFNLFNIKADRRWQGDFATVPTLEYRDGVAVREHAAFRAYGSAAESFRDFVDFVRSSNRYQGALRASDSEGFIQGLSQGGYATDPAYADKVLSILRSDRLQQALQQAGAAGDRG